MTAKRLETELQSLANASRPETVRSLLDEVKALRSSGVLLEEAFVLLKYNLEDLANRKDWQGK